MPQFIYHISWRKVAGQSLSKPWPDVFSRWQVWRQYCNRIHCVSTKVTRRHAKCGLAFSCWKMVYGRPRTQGTTTECNVSKMYQSSNYRRPELELCVYPMSSSIMIPGSRSLWQYRMKAADERFPRGLQTCIRPSEHCMQSQNSSKTTIRLRHTYIQLCHLAQIFEKL